MPTRLRGQIVGIRADRVGAAIALDNDPSVGPLNNEFILLGDHAQFNAVYSLALLAATNRWSILIRIGGDEQIDSTKEATIKSISTAFQ